MISADYKPVPVDVARQVGQHFEKSVVVIICVDDAHALVHATTWGLAAEQKQLAEMLGVAFSKIAGCDLSQRTDFENFAKRTAADSAAIIDRLIRERDHLLDVVAALKEAGHAG